MLRGLQTRDDRLSGVAFFWIEKTTTEIVVGKDVVAEGGSGDPNTPQFRFYVKNYETGKLEKILKYS